MIFGDTELESQEGMTEYKPEPTWTETVKASYQSFTSVGLSHSRDDHYKKEMANNAQEYSKADPSNKELYERISQYAYKDIERLEALYDEGNTDAIKSYTQTNPFNADIFLSQDFLKYKELQQAHGLKPQSQITEEINARALQEYTEAEEILSRSDSWTAEMVGTMGGAMTDIKTLQTLPLGTWKTGASITGTALRAAGEEMGIEALAQLSIAPEVYGFKKEIGVGTSISNEAINALAGIGTAGLFRGTFSAMYDLTEAGVKVLRVKDPELAADYEATFKHSDVSDNNKAFLDDMNRAEFEDPSTMEVSSPTEKGIELNKAEPIPFIKRDIMASIQENKAKPLEYEVLEIPMVRDIALQAKGEANKISQKMGFPDYIEDVYIVGSRATGKQKKLSDIDILIKTKTYDDLDKSAAATYVDEAMDEEIKKLSQTMMIDGEEVKIDYFMTDEFYNDNVIKVKREENFMLKVGTDEEGETVYKSFRELQEEHDMMDAYLNKAKDCSL